MLECQCSFGLIALGARRSQVGAVLLVLFEM